MIKLRKCQEFDEQHAGLVNMECGQVPEWIFKLNLKN